MKSIKFTILIALCSVIFCGCSKKDTTPPHLIAVPKNAISVFALNAKQIIEKAGLNDLEQYKMLSLVKQEIENQPVELRNFINDFLNDTRTSGLNLDNVFGYVAFNNRQEPCLGLSFLIDDVKKFEEAMKKSGLSGFGSAAGERKIELNPGTLQWNDKIAVMLTYSEEGIELLNSDESQSILTNETFKKAYEQDKDMFVFFDFNALYSLMNNVEGVDAQSLAIIQQYKDLSVAFSLNSEKGNLALYAKGFPEEKMSEIYEKYYKKDFNSALYQCFPDKSFLTLKFGFKPLDAYAEYKKNIETDASGVQDSSTTETVDVLDESGKVVDTETVDVDYGYASRYDYMSGLKSFIKQNDEKITSILGYFTGDVLASLWGFENVMMPEAGIAAGIVEGKGNDVIALMQEAGFTANGKGYYLLQANNMNIYFAIKDNIAYFTISEDAVAKFLAAGFSPNITSAKDFGAELKESNIYTYFNLNINEYPGILKALLSASEEGRMAMPLLLKLKSIKAKNVGTTASEMRIVFTDGEYASKIILQQIDELVSQYLIKGSR